MVSEKNDQEARYSKNGF